MNTLHSIISALFVGIIFRVLITGSFNGASAIVLSGLYILMLLTAYQTNKHFLRKGE